MNDQPQTQTGYDAHAVEEKWQNWWEAEKIYHFDHDSDKPVYSIDNPPRYASGPLHVGHAVHYTHIDFAARYKRMKGHNVFFPLCFDVNGMPIEVNVEKKYNIKMNEYDRHEFIKLCSEFAEQNIDEMTRQFKILGECMDPSIYYQTNAEYYRRLTQISFIQLFNKGLIYKGERPINWCPRCTTALSESEVEYRTRDTKFNYINFTLSETGEKVEIATTRPELLCTCHLVAIHPDDPRSEELEGKLIKTPIYEREVRIFTDSAVDPDFGTGIVMVCSIGDKDDLEWIQRYDIKIEKGIDKNGNMTELAGKYAGMSTTEAKAAIIEDMREQYILNKQEDLEQNVGCCWRCHTPIEFLVTPQWFLKTLDFKENVLNASDEIDWYPEFMKKRLEEWVNSLSWDWVISRQRYFATPIPLWECTKCAEPVVATEESCYIDPTIAPPPINTCPKCANSEFKGCVDVFDTWMDSSISPLFNTYWQREDPKFQKLYPMSMRPQSHDIIRTWAFYTILRGLLLTDQKPFNEIMMGGFILAPDGTPMHASKGNVIDPLEVLKKYGADGLRYYAASCALGKDNAFRWKEVKEGVRFVRKLWNVELLISNLFQNLGDTPPELDESKLRLIDKWILTLYSELVTSATNHMDNFGFDKARKLTVEFIWHELADHYLELVKYRIYRGNDEAVISTLYHIGLGIIKLIAPLLPHVTEEIYAKHYKALVGDKSIHLTTWPEPILTDETAKADGTLIKSITNAIRRWKSDNGIPLNQDLSFVGLVADSATRNKLEPLTEDIIETVKVKSLDFESSEAIEEKATGLKPIHSKIGPTFKKDAKEIVDKILSSDPIEINEALKTRESFELELASGDKIELTEEYIKLESVVTFKGENVESVKVGDIVIVLRA
ncbi:MAG: valine--tRNA ligase [Thermoplasmata archaeon]|nr:valine--tRNA ligase [Thermoplasmata archaeon]